MVSLFFLIWIFSKSIACFSLMTIVFPVTWFSCLTFLHWHSSIVCSSLPSWNTSPTTVPGACLFFPAFFLPHSNIILLMFTEIDTGKWFFQYSSLLWTWCFFQSLIVIPPFYFTLTGTHGKYAPFQLRCWMSVFWVKGFLGNTKYGKPLHLPPDQLVTDSCFYAEII